MLVHHLLGIQPSLDGDLRIAPLVGAGSGTPAGSVELGSSGHAVAYRWDSTEFVLQNLADTERTFAVDLSGSTGRARTPERVVLPAGGTVTFALAGARPPTSGPAAPTVG